MKLDRVSHSTISQAERCGEQLRFRLEEGPEPPGFSLIRGRAVASAIASNMTAKMLAGAQLEVEAVRAIARDEVDRELEVGEVRLDLEDDAGDPLGYDASRGRTVDDAVALAGLHALKVAPLIVPTGVEVKIRLESPVLPVPLVGILDLIAQDGDGEAVRDAKTTLKKPKAETADESGQLTVYDALYRALRNRPPTGLWLDHLIAETKTLAPRYFPQPTAPRGPADFAALVGRVERTVQLVEREAWMPAPEGAWWCSERFCGYWKRCLFARGRPRPTT